jgi:hypothetical protein
MRRIMVGLAGLVLSVALLSAEDKKPAAALPDHPLDAAFKKAKTEQQLDDAILNNKLYRKAVKEALKRRKEQEQKFKDNPKLADASPEQAARVKFLEVLQDQKAAKKDK